MGSMHYHFREGRQDALKQIAEKKPIYLVVLYGINPETNEEIQGGRNLFEEINKREIRKYVGIRTKETGLKATRVEVHSIELKLVEEFNL